MKGTEKKSLNSPDETRTFPKGKVEMATVGGVKFGRGTFDPGWKWSEHVKPIAKTKSCEAPHTQYHVSGRLHVRMDDGTEVEYGPGDVGHLPPGHDAWVVGNEPVVIIDVTGMVNYAKQS
jgi:quercetin dioxygenase-like cupin family protein